MTTTRVSCRNSTPCIHDEVRKRCSEPSSRDVQYLTFHISQPFNVLSVSLLVSFACFCVDLDTSITTAHRAALLSYIAILRCTSDNAPSTAMFRFMRRVERPHLVVGPSLGRIVDLTRNCASREIAQAPGHVPLYGSPSRMVLTLDFLVRSCRIMQHATQGKPSRCSIHLMTVRVSRATL